ncbi:MAG: XTP/dITP diphosphatase [Fusobacterium sp.]
MKILLATGNKNKIKEIKKILNIKNIDILSIKDGIEIPDVIENGNTFEENSKKKALEIAKFTNMLTIADDSGLCVKALDGKPGIYSARYAGEHATDEENNKKLIQDLKGVENRKAKFVCVITLAKPTGETYSFKGEMFGEIIDEPRGKEGFGYDPYFYIPKYRKTTAEMSDKKNEISHRALAIKLLKEKLSEILK